MHFDPLPSNNYHTSWGGVFGFVAVLITKGVVFLAEQTSLSWQSVLDTLVIGALGAVSGFVVTAVIKWGRYQLARVVRKVKEFRNDDSN